MRRTRFAVAAVLVVVAGSTLASTAPSPGEGWLRWGVFGLSEATPAPIDGMLGRATSPVALPTSAVGPVRAEGSEGGAPERPVVQAPAMRPEPPPVRAGGLSVKIPEVTREGQVVVREARVPTPRASSLEGAKVRPAPSLTAVLSRPAGGEAASDAGGSGGVAAAGGAGVREGVVEMPQNSGKARGSSGGSKVKSFRGLATRATRRTVNPDAPQMSAASKPVAAAIAASVKPTAKPAAKPMPKTVTTKATATVVKRVS